MKQLLLTKLNASKVSVVDISGGCGSMFDIQVESELFQGQSRVKQHQMVNAILKAEIGSMHGLTVKTSIPKQ